MTSNETLFVREQSSTKSTSQITASLCTRTSLQNYIGVALPCTFNPLFQSFLNLRLISLTVIQQLTDLFTSVRLSRLFSVIHLLPLHTALQFTSKVKLMTG